MINIPIAEYQENITYKGEELFIKGQVFDKPIKSTDGRIKRSEASPNLYSKIMFLTTHEIEVGNTLYFGQKLSEKELTKVVMKFKKLILNNKYAIGE